MPHPAYILSGGQSRRFGSDKSRHMIEGQPQLVRLSQQLVDCGHQVHIVADRADRYTDLGITCIVDEVADSGPLAGLAAALAHRSGQVPRAAPPGADSPDIDSPKSDGWILLVNCDQAHWDAAWYPQLLGAITPQSQAVAYFDQHWHPLPALYHCSLLPGIRVRLTQQQLSLQSLLDAARAMKVSTNLPPSRWSFNFKT